MIGSLVTSILLGAIGALITFVGIYVVYSGQFVGWPIIMVGLFLMAFVGVINTRK